MLKIYKETGYILEPHGAVGYLGLKEYQKGQQETTGIFLETAHPVKFLEVVEPVINKSIAFPEQIKNVINKTKEASFISNYEELKSYLINR